MKNELFSSKAMLSAGVSGAAAASPAFAAVDMEPGFGVAVEDEALMLAQEGSCGEGTCGGSSGGEEGSCGEGTCGESAGGEEGSCGEGTCGASASGEEGSCGEGACGESAGGEEGACGEGTCGGG